MSGPQNSHANLDPMAKEINSSEIKGGYGGGVDDHRAVKQLENSCFIV
jgi:hypothetical protein